MTELLREGKAQGRWARIFPENEQFQFGNMQTLVSRFRVHFEAVHDVWSSCSSGHVGGSW